MEDLQNLMACIDEIASQIPDGMYLKMADQMKRVHDHMNGNKPIHEDTFYYSDDDSVSDSDSDYESDSDFAPANLDRQIERAQREQRLRDQLLDAVKKMHEEYKVLMKWEKEARRTFDPNQAYDCVSKELRLSSNGVKRTSVGLLVVRPGNSLDT